MWMTWCITYRSALGPSRTAPSARPGGDGGSGGSGTGSGGGGAGAGLAGVGLAGECFGPQLSALSAAVTNRTRRIHYSFVLVRPKMATTSVSSLMTLRSFHPRRVSLLIWPCSDRGLPCRACCQTRGGLLPHRFTLTLWIQGRSVLCGPVPSPLGAQALPGGLPCGARTFLEWPLLPIHRDHRPHHFQAGKLPATGAARQVLLREAPDH